MRRSSVLLALVVVLVLLARLVSRPVYAGAPREDLPPGWNAVSAPFGDDLRGSCNAFLSMLAGSLRREGLAATGGIPVLNVEDAAPADYWYYDHHTPGVPLVTALAFELAGQSERTARLVALLFATLTTGVLVTLVAREWGVAAALVAGAAQGFLPMGLFWGTHLNFEVPTLPFLVLFLAAALRDRPSWRSAGLWLLLAFLMDVVALFAVAAVALEVLLRRRPRDLVPLFGGALLLALGWMAWRAVQLSRHGHTTASSLEEHLLHSTMLSPQFHGKEWAGGVLRALLVLGGGWPVALLAFETGALFLRPAATRLDRMFRAALVVAVLNVVVPAIQATGHEYYVLYFQVPLALACARFARRVAAALARFPRIPAAVLALALLVQGLVLDLRRDAPDPTFPASHRLGRELAVLAEGQPGVFLLPPYQEGGPSWQLVTVMWYAGRLVLEAAPQDPAGAALRSTVLAAQGLSGVPFLLAEPRQWPGQGGLTVLPAP